MNNASIEHVSMTDGPRTPGLAHHANLRHANHPVLPFAHAREAPYGEVAPRSLNQ